MSVKKGMDVSYHQGKIDFDMVKKSGVEFVILREGYRDSTDSRFFEYVREAKKVDLPIIGVYHFSYALNIEEVKKEALLCIENIKKAGLNSNILVFFDFEYDTVKKAAAKGVSLTKVECNSHTLAFCEEVKRLGYEPGIYTNLDYYKNWYKKDLLDKYKIWLADYTGGPDFTCLIQQYMSKGAVPGIKGNVDLNYYYDEEFKMGGKNMRSRSDVVNLVESWIGKKESDGSYKSIIDIYNSFTGPFPRGTRMKYSWSWCACTWSALAIALGYTDIMPIEISVKYLIDAAKKMNCWQENDGYIPLPGDAICYDWDDNGIGDNTGWPDHVGTVTYVNKEAGYFVVVEGNYSNSVKKRTMSINGKFIRGFITPKYTDNSVIDQTIGASKDVKTIAMEVISGLWGSGSQRKEALERNGLNYAEVQSMVNKILNESYIDPVFKKKVEATCNAKSKDELLSGTYMTTANLYCRNDAGSNKKALCLIPRGAEVKNSGSYTEINGVKWLLIQFVLNNVQYSGFSSSKYLKKL